MSSFEFSAFGLPVSVGTYTQALYYTQAHTHIHTHNWLWLATEIILKSNYTLNMKKTYSMDFFVTLWSL